MIDLDFWRGRRVLVTGHTGFKGSWLCLWLGKLGAEVHGLALEPSLSPNLFELAGLGEKMFSHICDIRNFEGVSSLAQRVKPQIVFHMAAQPLVRTSYEEPLVTYSTNVMGTLHLLEVARHLPSLEALVNITTDKCYDNKEWVWGYRETDAMGGHDPYSSSKGCAEILTASYRKSFFSGCLCGIATARAGNVIGGGDWSTDRLVPDALTGFQAGSTVKVRNPKAIRPWQHVLEPLHGYLLLAQKLVEDPSRFSEAWNFGPNEESSRSVQWVMDELVARWPTTASWEPDADSHPHEAQLLRLDISKARSLLGWRPKWTIEKALQLVVDWHQAWGRSEDIHSVCMKQIDLYAEA
jgi:CDP-glucose 4,6-dehydratase